ncbi:RNA polymerase III subunit [Heterostelium album PN500]|uniref:DNA-directed RNA polymerase III subunit RPC9 n=1 Tax=Heterostelium pallidum (strain ATCC 26659 / Pp 5 / PN500) TaxID=670386 RepID=D3BQM2_HETP5|nr:RNA polymerase III subunit [Heterostelium album PN500]EFA76442.1 RNA polymerase III subunit [Heterostelium album PN500]|eukprot:XP_020428574.1 RNA polymerase III subunit [Heterostelium album PN500]
MKIISNKYDELITNYEVLNLLKHKRKIKGQALLNEFVSSVVGYLETTPAAKQTDEIVKETKELCKQNKLTKAETLQIINLAPTTEVEIHLIVEEAVERLDPVAFTDDVRFTMEKDLNLQTTTTTTTPPTENGNV